MIIPGQPAALFPANGPGVQYVKNREASIFRTQLLNGLGSDYYASSYADLPKDLYAAVPGDPATWKAPGNPYPDAPPGSMGDAQQFLYNINYLESLKALQNNDLQKVSAMVAYSANNLTAAANAMGVTKEEAATTLVAAAPVSNAADYVAGNAISAASNDYAAQTLSGTSDTTIDNTFALHQEQTNNNEAILQKAVAKNPNATSTIATVINTPESVKTTLKDLVTTSMAAGETGGTTTQKAALNAIDVVAAASVNPTATNIAKANTAIQTVNTLAAQQKLAATTITGTNLKTGTIVVTTAGTGGLNKVTLVDANGNAQTALVKNSTTGVKIADAGTTVTGVDNVTHTVTTDGTIATTVGKPGGGMALLGAIALGAFLLGKI